MATVILAATVVGCALVIDRLRMRRVILLAAARPSGRFAALAARLDRSVLVAAGVGALWRGVVGAWIGLGVGVVRLEVLRRRGIRQRAIRCDAQSPALARSLATSLRAGRTLEQAIEAAADEIDPPLGSFVETAAARLAAGRPRGAVLELLDVETPGTAMATITETVRIGSGAAQRLPEILDHVAESLTERERLAADRRAGTAQARLSAIIVGGMPVVFLAMTAGSASAPARTLVGEPAGLVLLVVGLGLETAGIVWVRRVMRA